MSCSRALSCINIKPLRQVTITVNTTTLKATGNQPPSSSLRVLAEKKMTSINMKKDAPSTARQGCQRHIAIAIPTAKKSVINMVPVTAMP